MMKNSRDTTKRFSIRKITVGVVSVMFGAVIFGVSTNQVHADANEISNQVAAQAVAKQTTTDNNEIATQKTQPTDQNNYNEEVQKNAPALLADDTAKDPARTDQLVDRGVTNEVSVSAENKNTSEKTEVKGLTKADQKSDANVVINTATAKNFDFNITLHNTTTNDQKVDGGNYWYGLPAFNGTSKNIVVDSSRLKRDAQGNIVFGGNYQNSGLSITNFDLATDEVHSTGLSKNIEEASVDPSKIGGFMVTGTIKAGDTVTITVPLMVRNSEKEQAVNQHETIGVLWKDELSMRAAAVVSDLDAQKDKKYFLVDTDKTQGCNYYGVEQRVIDDLNKEGLYPIYQAGDVAINNFAFADPANDDQTYLTAGGYVVYQNAVSRLNKILNKYGYQVANVPGAGAVTSGNGAYALRSDLKFFDANGKPVELGKGDLSNFFIPVKQVIKQSEKPAIIDYMSPKANVTDEVKAMFDAEQPLAFTGIDQINPDQAGIYTVTANVGNVSRTLKVIVVKYATILAYKNSDPHHFEVLPTNMVSDESLKDLADNGYTVAWAKDTSGNDLKPTYEMPGDKEITLTLTDPDGRVYQTNDTVDVLQGINVHFVERNYDANGKLVSTKEDKVITVYGSVGHEGHYISQPQTIDIQKGQFSLDPDWKDLVAKGFSIDGIKDMKFVSQKENQDVTVYVDHHAGPTTPDDNNPGNNPEPNTPSDNLTPIPEPDVTPSEDNNTPKSTPVLPENTPAAAQSDNNTEKAAPVHGQKQVTNEAKANEAKTIAKQGAKVTPVNTVKPKATRVPKLVQTNVEQGKKAVAHPATLPQTGSENTTVLGVIGMLLASLGLFGLADRKKKNN